MWSLTANHLRRHGGRGGGRCFAAHQHFTSAVVSQHPARAVVLRNWTLLCLLTNVTSAWSGSIMLQQQQTAIRTSTTTTASVFSHQPQQRRYMSSHDMAEHPKPTFKYLNLGKLGGRGGVVRFFLLAHGIEFDEVLYDMKEEWPAIKAKLAESGGSGENPVAKVPILKVGDVELTQHIALLRELARLRGLSAGDFASDAVADEYQGFRDAWVKAAFGDDNKEAFQELVTKKLQVFEGLYEKYGHDAPYLAVGSDGMPLWGDIALASLFRDIMVTGLIPNLVDQLPPKLKAMYTAFVSIPAVSQWIAEKEAKK